MTKDKRLGRGLAALLGSEDEGGSSLRQNELRVHTDDESASATTEHGRLGSRVRVLSLAVDDVASNPFQPRREFRQSEIESLAESLKEHDQIQPILVREVDGGYQLISGERRLRAAIHAGFTHIKAHIREADDRLVAELAIVENLQRKDLNAIEKALSFKRYLDEHDCTQEDLGQRLKIDRSTIANLLRLLELPEEVQDAVRRSRITAGHARALLPLGDDLQQREFCRRIRHDGMSVRETEREVQTQIAKEDGLNVVGGGAKKTRTQNQQVVSLEQNLRRALGTKVEVRPGTRGRGKIVLHFTSHEEFERLYSYLAGSLDDELSANVG